MKDDAFINQHHDAEQIAARAPRALPVSLREIATEITDYLQASENERLMTWRIAWIDALPGLSPESYLVHFQHNGYATVFTRDAKGALGIADVYSYFAWKDFQRSGGQPGESAVGHV